MQLHETQVKELVIHEGKSFKFCLDEVRLPNGSIVQREVVRHPGGVAILALDNDMRCIMVEQYRHVIQQTTMEIPAGKLDKVPGETPLEGAKRELEEETGLIAGEWTYIGNIYPSPGIIDEKLHLFLAKGLHNSKQNLDEDEFINLHWIPMKQIFNDIACGAINDCKLISVLLLSQLQGKLPHP